MEEEFTPLTTVTYLSLEAAQLTTTMLTMEEEVSMLLITVLCPLLQTALSIATMLTVVEVSTFTVTQQFLLMATPQ